MDLIDVLGDFGPLDALEQRIENPPVPGDVLFQDPLCQMLDKLERGIEVSEVKPPLVPEEPGILENPSQGHLPPQEQSQKACSELGTMDSPPLPYYLENPQIRATRSLPGIPNRRIGRCGGRGFINSPGVQSDQTYCPIERDFVSVETICEDCEYYHEDGDPETGSPCTYNSEEEP